MSTDSRLDTPRYPESADSASGRSASRPAEPSAQYLMGVITSDTVLDEAYAWLCDRRKEYSANNDVWDLRWRWAERKPQLQAELRAGTYQLNPVQRIRKPDETLELWAAVDALVLKAIAIVLTRQLAPQLPAACHHLVGHGGVKAAVRTVAEQLADNTFVFRTDVKRYYASINHDILFAQLQGLPGLRDDPRVLAVLWQCLRRTVVEDGLYAEVLCGISLGCPLSPLFGALYLQPLDEQMARTGLVYARFMDDWVILAPTRWKLRAAIQQVNTILADLQVEQHPDKTFIGRIARGFEFLGYAFSPQGLGIARQATDRMLDRVHQLYEQRASQKRLEAYVQRWLRWVQAGLDIPVQRSRLAFRPAIVISATVGVVPGTCS